MAVPIAAKDSFTISHIDDSDTPHHKVTPMQCTKHGLTSCSLVAVLAGTLERT